MQENLWDVSVQELGKLMKNARVAENKDGKRMDYLRSPKKKSPGRFR